MDICATRTLSPRQRSRKKWFLVWKPEQRCSMFQNFQLIQSGQICSEFLRKGEFNSHFFPTLPSNNSCLPRSSNLLHIYLHLLLYIPPIYLLFCCRYHSPLNVQLVFKKDTLWLQNESDKTKDWTSLFSSNIFWSSYSSFFFFYLFQVRYIHSALFFLGSFRWSWSTFFFLTSRFPSLNLSKNFFLPFSIGFSYILNKLVLSFWSFYSPFSAHLLYLSMLSHYLGCLVLTFYLMDCNYRSIFCTFENHPGDGAERVLEELLAKKSKAACRPVSFPPARAAF